VAHTENEISIFIDRQLALWPEVRFRFEQLGAIFCKQLPVNNADICVQYNPLRVHSTTAKVDAVSVGRRACFLCVDNRPPEQIYITWNNYQILINPYPILPKHLSLVDSRHLPQSIAGRVGDMLALAKYLEGFLICYNGPQCGASAPDHFHFQAVDGGHTPLEQWMDENSGQSAPKKDFGFSGLRFLLSDSCPEVLCSYFQELYQQFEPVTGTEPMMNVFCRYRNNSWEMVVIPRRKHRPDRYFAVGESQLQISPGALDMAGIVVTARESDFHRITATDMVEIYREVAIHNS
jgi:hypothetical protein